MVKGRRPGEHRRVVRTKRGKRSVLVNRGLPRRTKRKDFNPFEIRRRNIAKGVAGADTAEFNLMLLDDENVSFQRKQQASRELADLLGKPSVRNVLTERSINEDLARQGIQPLRNLALKRKRFITGNLSPQDSDVIAEKAFRGVQMQTMKAAKNFDKQAGQAAKKAERDLFDELELDKVL